MCSCVTQVEGTCNRHANCRNVQNCSQRMYCLFLYKSRLQLRFREFDSISNQSHNRRPCVPMPAQDLHIRLLHQWDHLRPATRTADETEDYFCLESRPFVGIKSFEWLGLAPQLLPFQAHPLLCPCPVVKSID